MAETILTTPALKDVVHKPSAMPGALGALGIV